VGLSELAAAVGVATEFWDWQGEKVIVAPGTLTAVLSALGVDASDPERALAELRGDAWRRMLPAALVVLQGERRSVDVHVPHGSGVELWVELESGRVRRDLVQLGDWQPPERVDDDLVGEATFELPDDLALGYHTLHARAGTASSTMPLIVTPATLPMPEQLREGRAWGLATQLYSVRSTGSWGVGDLTDLTDLAVWASAEHDADYVLVNPLHAVELTPPMEPSPYLPTTRRYANPIYLRVERIPEYAELDARARAEVVRLGEVAKSTLNSATRIDRDAAWRAKSAALHLVQAVPRSAGRELAYRAYQWREGEALRRFATWCAIAETHGSDWRSWPEGLRDPDSDDVRKFVTAHAAAVDFHRWLQWLVDEQLDNAQAAARRAGMSIGGMHDLAVGVHPSGADAWSMRDVFAQGVTVGAPPDAYSQKGQDWSQPPWRPDRLAEVGYRPFRDLVAASLRHAGGIRVDHVIGLFRLWWIPEGASPTDGTYVRYDHDALIGILALEALRANAVVVGEDVGVVEPEARTYLRDRGILGTSILWFERDYDGDKAPLRPDRWRELCMASVTTHDLPPTAGYLAGDHVRLRAQLGLLARTLEDELAEDEAARHSWLETLRHHGLLGPDSAVDETVTALHRFLALTPARLLCVALTDAVGDRRMQNQPGTTDEYPNWRVPLSGPDSRPISLEEVFDSTRASRLFRALVQE
jgi:4-alpha-glucanotransferase